MDAAYNALSRCETDIEVATEELVKLREEIERIQTDIAYYQSTARIERKDVEHDQGTARPQGREEETSSPADPHNLHRTVQLFEHTAHHPECKTRRSSSKYGRPEHCTTCLTSCLDLECWNPANHKTALRRQPWLRWKERQDRDRIAAGPTGEDGEPRGPVPPEESDMESCSSHSHMEEEEYSSDETQDGDSDNASSLGSVEYSRKGDSEQKANNEQCTDGSEDTSSSEEGSLPSSEDMKWTRGGDEGDAGPQGTV